jgi:hypothetical protein
VSAPGPITLRLLLVIVAALFVVLVLAGVSFGSLAIVKVLAISILLLCIALAVP